MLNFIKWLWTPLYWVTERERKRKRGQGPPREQQQERREVRADKRFIINGDDSYYEECPVGIHGPELLNTISNIIITKQSQ